MKTLTPKLKQQLTKLAIAHQKADEYRSGHYQWREGEGACSIGCTIRDAKKLKLLSARVDEGSHANWGEVSGMGILMARLQDSIFEGLSRHNGDGAGFTPRVMTALKCGADYSMAWPKMAVFILEGLPQQKQKDAAKSVAEVLSLYHEWIKTGQKPERSRWAAAAYAAYAAAYAAYADAAAAAYAAAYAAYAAYADARKDLWARLADKFCDLLAA